MSSFPVVTPAEWRAQVEKELAGRSFEKTLVQHTLEGLAIAPLYTEAPGGLLPRETRTSRFRICMREEPGVKLAELAAEVAGGADACWLASADTFASARSRAELAQSFFVVDGSPSAILEEIGAAPGPSFALTHDPLGQRASGRAPRATLDADLAALGAAAAFVAERHPGSTAVMISTLPYHDAGADAADELALALATAATYLEAMLAEGVAIERAVGQVAFQIAVGRDTFLELCKLRALRTCWQKLTTAAGVTAAPRVLVHAVCSSRTLSVRDPWVNMLRVTTQLFAGILGGADLVTPATFDQASGAPSALGRRVARNSGLVLREESFLGKVTDPAGGSYYLETVTDALARAAWQRFQTLEREGGVTKALASGQLLAKLEAVWQGRLEQLAKRKTPILGVSEFANLDETLPRPAPSGSSAAAVAPAPGALPTHRDAAAFEALREVADAQKPEALLVTLGPLAESRPRAGFAAGFFAAGGIRPRESTTDEKVALACLCGSDERYAAEAVARARALKSAGCGRVLLAGRPGALEPALREAGVDGFIFAGCDAVAVLSELLEVTS